MMVSKGEFVWLYEDAYCRVPLKRDAEDRWIFACGKLDPGQRKSSSFYILNRTAGLIDDVEIDVGEPVKRDGSPKSGLRVELMSQQKIREINPLEASVVNIDWVASEAIRAGIARVPVTVTGYVTVEE